MGSRELISFKETEEFLAVSATKLRMLVRRGLLRPTYQGRKLFFYTEELSAFLEAQAFKNDPLKGAVEAAQQAWAMARVAQRQVAELQKMLGLTAPDLELTEEGIRWLFDEAQNDLTVWDLDVERLEFWAQVFHGMCDMYLHRMRAVLKLPEPWSIYLRLSSHLTEVADVQKRSTTNLAVYQSLAIGRRRLREAIFTYLLQTEGRPNAKRVFANEFFGASHEVMAMSIEHKD